MKKNNKFDLYEHLKILLQQSNFVVENYKEINFGLQFNVSQQGNKHLVRIYEGKKGTRLDLSQVKDLSVQKQLSSLMTDGKPVSYYDSTAERSDGGDVINKDIKLNESKGLLGTDESGKGDYFGPLVISGVYTDKVSAEKLHEYGVTDSKRLSDSNIEILASKIKNICRHSIVAIGNEKYNELYKKIGNLNKLLAWGHARCIENVLDQVEASVALSDQFGDESFIKNALLEKGKKIILKQEPKAEKYIAVAAASILARNEFVRRLSKMGDKYNLKFPKGASQQTIEIAKRFVELYGRNKLNEVVKLHFKTTNNL